MLRRFSVANYRSFKEEAVLDFTLDKKDKGQGWYRDYSGGKGKAFPVSTVAGVFGANASGKSVLLKALDFLLLFATYSAELSSEAMSMQSWFSSNVLPVQPWFNNSEPCHFKIEYQNKDNIFYEYALEVARDGVKREVLKTKKTYSTKEWTVVYERLGNELKERKGVFKEINYSFLRSNVSVLSLTRQQGADIDHIIQPLAKLVHFLPNYTQRLSTNMLIQGSASLLNTLLEKDKDYAEKIISQVTRFLVESDTDIIRVDFEKSNDTLDEDGDASFSLYGVHKFEDGSEKRLSFSLESEGTRVLFSYLVGIFMSLSKGSPFIIDEFDSALHLLVQQKIVELFDDDEENPYGSQLIFTTHSENLMNIIGKAHIYLTEKVDNKSNVWRLDEMEGVRTTDNYRSKYLAGVYGGVPLL